MLDLWQVDEEVHCGPHLRRVLAEEAKVVNQFGGRIEGLLAFVALVASRIRELAKGTAADDKSIS